mmetsp:Transcript_55969/g.91128  ORF Transcript_55969/g.91128 Transcript_55969/m.91128 type:complete len:251 (+) Transcript_55969:418-1170(+)
MRIGPALEEPLATKDEPLQTSVERIDISNAVEDHGFILRSAGFTCSDVQTREFVVVLIQQLLGMDLHHRGNAAGLGFHQLRHTPGPHEDLEVIVHRCHQTEVGDLTMKQVDHVIKLVHFALDALPVRVHRQCRVENLGGRAVAYRMRNVCHWIHVCSWVGTTNSPVLIDCKGTNPVGLVHALLLSQHPLHHRHASSIREKLSNELKGMFTQRVSDDTGQQVAKVVGPIVRYHLVREHLRVVDHVRIGAGG